MFIIFFTTIDDRETWGKSYRHSFFHDFLIFMLPVVNVVGLSFFLVAINYNVLVG